MALYYRILPPGADGAAATIAVGPTTTGLAGYNDASVTNSGTTSAAVFDFTLSQKVTREFKVFKEFMEFNGILRDTRTFGGRYPLVRITTVTHASGVSVTNSGTPENAVFNFNIPEGPTGQDGTNGTNGTNGAYGTNYFTLSGSDITRSSGNVGIGKNPGVKLDVEGRTCIRIRYD